MPLSEVFFMSVATLGSGLCASLIAILYKSKCSTCNLCCGLISFKRDIQSELSDHRLELQNIAKSFAMPPAGNRQSEPSSPSSPLRTQLTNYIKHNQNQTSLQADI